MRRRSFLKAAGLGAAGMTGGAALALQNETQDIYKDKYWQAQAHIEALEQEVSELKAHAMIMKKAR